ncbi:acyltransferase family protein [Phenylobacterium sp.]|uniref:acyltransferase family protein n=1 Tax=Phenylobacterium sp. TaxID=1871053 RepID=UPI003BAB7C16
MPVKNETGRSVALDFLRFAAAGLVVLYHYQSEGPFPLSQLSPIFLRGYLVTDLFLILSGYVLGRAYGRQVAASAISDEHFLLRRVLRIWPAHLAMLTAFAAVIFAAGLAGRPPAQPEAFQWGELPAQALLIHAWSGHGGGWNLPTWTLSALVICYAAFPTVWRRLRGVGDGLFLFLGGMGLIWLADLAVRRAYGQTIYDLHFNLGVIRALPMFVFGMCVARAAECGWPRAEWAAGLTLAAGTAAALLQALGRFDLLSVALLGLTIAACGQMRMTWGADLAARAARISFALYITHILVGILWFNAERALVGRLHPPAWEQWAFWACALPAALVVATLFDRWVDQPMQRGVARVLKNRLKPAGPKLGPAGLPSA